MKQLVWKYDAAFDTFEVFRPSSSAGPELVIGTTSTLPTAEAPYTLPPDAPFGSYNVRVRAKRGTFVSPPSNEVSVSNPPPAPYDLTVL